MKRYGAEKRKAWGKRMAAGREKALASKPKPDYPPRLRGKRGTLIWRDDLTGEMITMAFYYVRGRARTYEVFEDGNKVGRMGISEAGRLLLGKIPRVKGFG